MKFIMTLLLTWVKLVCVAQSYGHIEESFSNPFLSDANGHPLYTNSKFIAEGHPYFNDDYRFAQITAANGAIYRHIKVKINIQDRVVQYLATDGREMVADILVKRVLFLNYGAGDGNFQNILLEGFPTAINSPGSTTCEILDSGSIKLLKKITIVYRDTKNYNEAVTTRVFERKESFYSLKGDGQLRKIKKGRSAMLDLLNDKKDKIALFIDTHKLSCKSETDYKKIFAFYNTDF